jgi:hypothetical protein
MNKKRSMLAALIASSALAAAVIVSSAVTAANAAGDPPPPPPSVKINPTIKQFGGNSTASMEIHLPASLPNRFHFTATRDIAFSCNATTWKMRVSYEIHMVMDRNRTFVTEWNTLAQTQGIGTMTGGRAFIQGATLREYGAGERFTFGKMNKYSVAPAVQNNTGRVDFEQQRYFFLANGCTLPTLIQIM